MSDAPHDVVVSNQGTVWTFYLETPDAQDWVTSSGVRAETEPHQWLGEHILVVDHRYGEDVVLGMREDGLIVVGRE